MWVCESMSPGNTVLFERSITFAPEGIASPDPLTLTIRSPRTKISWFFRGVSLTPSISVPARITVTAPPSVALCARAASPLVSAPSVRHNITLVANQPSFRIAPPSNARSLPQSPLSMQPRQPGERPFGAKQHLDENTKKRNLGALRGGLGKRG